MCKKSESNELELLLGMPISETQVNDYEDNFRLCYKSVNQFEYDVLLEVDVKEIKDKIPPDYLSSSDKGIAFHYILIEDGNEKYFSYAFGLWNKASTGINFDIPLKKFVNGKTWENITKQDVTSLKNKYYGDVLIKNLDSGKISNVSDANAIIDHPKISYFEGKEINDFLNHNNGMEGIKIINGANNRLHNEFFKGFKLHSPILVGLKKGGDVMLNNDANGGSYNYRGLDVGRLCPPQCK